MDSREPTGVSTQALVTTLVGIPFAIALTALLIQLWMLPSLPGLVTTHWDISGKPDRFSTPTTNILVNTLITFGVPVVCFSAVILSKSRDHIMGRFLGIASIAMTLYFAVFCTGVLYMQVGLTDARDAQNVTIPIITGALLAVIAGTITYIKYPSGRHVADSSQRSGRMRVLSGSHTVWVGHASLDLGGKIIFAIALTVITGLTVFTWNLPDELWSHALLLSTLGFIVLLCIDMSYFRVSITSSGIFASSRLGWPNVKISLNEVTNVSIVVVRPLPDFGGWGFRRGSNGIGLITHPGEALYIERIGKRPVTITLDGAREAASLLKNYIDM